MPERPEITRALVPPNSRRAEFLKLFLPAASGRRIAAKNLFDALTGRVGLVDALRDTPTTDDGRLRRWLPRNRPVPPPPGERVRGVHVVIAATTSYGPGSGARDHTARPAGSRAPIESGPGDAAGLRALTERSIAAQVHPPTSVVDATGFDPAQLPAGDLVVFVRPGDVLETELTALLAAVPTDVDLVSWDDVLGDARGRPTSPRIRPRWSPDTHLVAPYLHRAFAVGAGAAAAAGWRPQDPGLDATDLWRLVDGVDPAPARTLRLPWFCSRAVDRVDHVDPDAIRRSLARRGVDASPDPDGLRLRFPPASSHAAPRVTIVVPTRHHRANLSQLLPALERTAHEGVELVIVDNGGRGATDEAWYRDAPFASRTTVEWWDRPFNWSAVNNAGARSGSGDVLVFCNDDALPIRADWLDDLCGWLTVPGVGSAGPVIVDSSGRVGEAGIAAGLADLCEHLMRGADPRGTEMLGPVGWPRDVLAVTGACVAVRRETFEAVGGFDEDYELTGSDVAFGVSVMGAGLRNVCTGLASVRHDERTTRRGLDHPHDVERLTACLTPFLDDDPVFSPQLSRWHARPRLATAAEQRRRSDPAGRTGG